jgi:tRNA(Ile)-lysidine synthetase-like protein
VTELEALAKAALEKARVARGSGLLAAVSGGPDSTALLLALNALRETLDLSVSVCIVDHGIRDAREIEGDVSFVRNLCDARGIRVEVARIAPGACAARARETAASIEEVARDMRHPLLIEAARRAGARFVALGHTEDDALETILMRVLQGSGAEGLRGIAFSRGPFVRPLLGCTRAQVMEYLAEKGQGWREDSTNRNTLYFRNRVRHVLLPVLRESFPGHRRGLLTLADKMAGVNDLVRQQAEKLEWRAEGAGFAISRVEFFASHPAARASSLLALYDRFRPAGSSRRLPWRFLAPALVEEDPHNEGWILRGHGARLAAAAGKLSWGPDIASRGKKGYFIEVSEAGNAAFLETGVRVKFARGFATPGAREGGLRILRREVEPPLVLRSKRKGDEILLDGGSTSVKDIFAGWKVPAGQRDRIPLLTDRKGVLAVLGSALGYGTRARAGALAGNFEDVDRIEIDTDSDMEEGREQQQR